MNIFKIDILDFDEASKVRVVFDCAEHYLIRPPVEIKGIPGFPFTPLTGFQVHSRIESWAQAASISTKYELTIKKLTYPWYKRASYRRTVAVHSGDTIYLHLPIFFGKGRDFADNVNTAYHETLHEVGFGHGGNDINADHDRMMLSVPYRLGAMVEALVRANQDNLA